MMLTMKHSLSRGEKNLFILSGILLLGFGGFAMLTSHLGAEPDWPKRAPKRMPQPNGYDLYVAAGAAIIPANPPVDPAQMPRPRYGDNPKPLVIQYSETRRKAWLKKNAKVEKLFQRAKAANSLYSQSPAPPGARIWASKALTSLTEYKIVALNTARLIGDWNSAAQIGLDIIEMGGDMARGGALGPYRASTFKELEGISVFGDTAKHLSGSEAKYAVRRLEKLISARPPLVDAVREQKWVNLRVLHDTLDTKTWRQIETWEFWHGVGRVELNDTLSLRFLSKRQVVESYLRVCDWNTAHIQEPFNSSSSTAPESDSIINRSLIQENSEVKRISAEADTRISLFLLRLALRGYQVEKGVYPTKLEELVPRYLMAVPLDPFGKGAPLCYQKGEGTYEIWSVGDGNGTIRDLVTPSRDPFGRDVVTEPGP